MSMVRLHHNNPDFANIYFELAMKHHYYYPACAVVCK